MSGLRIPTFDVVGTLRASRVVGTSYARDIFQGKAICTDASYCDGYVPGIATTKEAAGRRHLKARFRSNFNFDS